MVFERTKTKLPTTKLLEENTNSVPSLDAPLLTGNCINDLAKNETVGLPSRKSTITYQDTQCLLLGLGCFILATVAVFHVQTAVILGQTYQLVVVGFALTIMSYCLQREALLVAILLEQRFGRSSLQNYDALLRNNAFSNRSSLPVRAFVLSLLAIPLALSVSYKIFANGRSTTSGPETSGYFGFIAAPGLQNIGNGNSLLVNNYLPFWSDPEINRTYGFSMYVESNTTAAILDGPMPDLVRSLQVQILSDESFLLTASVNATVTEQIPITDSQRNDENFWADVTSERDYEDIDLLFGFKTGMLSGDSDWSDFFISIWNYTANETFESVAERYNTTRRTCQGTWNITSTSITLVHAQNLQTAAECSPSSEYQSIITSNLLGLTQWFGTLVPEYNWRWNTYHANTSINTRAPLIASMIWSRIVSLDGAEIPDNNISSSTYLPGAWGTYIQYPVPAEQLQVLRSRTTLRRSPSLAIVLVVQPVLLILAVVLKVMLVSVPIDDGFGVISLLSAANPQQMAILRGGGLSGRLSREVRMRFVVDGRKKGGGGKIRVDFDASGVSDRIQKNGVYE